MIDTNRINDLTGADAYGSDDEKIGGNFEVAESLQDRFVLLDPQDDAQTESDSSR